MVSRDLESTDALDGEIRVEIQDAAHSNGKALSTHSPTKQELYKVGRGEDTFSAEFSIADTTAIVSNREETHLLRIGLRAERSVVCDRQRLAESARDTERLDETLGRVEARTDPSLSESNVNGIASHSSPLISPVSF